MHATATASLPSAVKAVLFDMDDTLVDSERAWRVAARHLWLAHDLGQAPSLPPGGSVDDVVDMFIRSSPSHERDTVTAHFLTLLDEALGTSVEPMPGAAELIAGLDPELPIAIASNSPSQVVRRTVASLGWQDRVSAALGTEDVTRAKPAPDLYLEAARRCHARIEHCVVFEDSSIGAQAATDSGAFVVAIGDARPRHVSITSLLDPLVVSWRPRLARDALR